MARGKKTDQVRIEAAERRVKALDYRKAGASFRAIGDALGVSVKTAHQDVQAALADLSALEQGSAEQLRALELARLDDLVLVATRILQVSHPLVSGGKVLSGFTADGKAIGLTDDGPKLAAIEKLIRISESRRKLLGLDQQAGGDTINILVNPQWVELRAVILQAISAYPDAQRALAAAITEAVNHE